MSLTRSFHYQELGLSYPIYQVLIYESYMPYFRSYSFSDLLRVTNKDNNSFEHVNIDNHDIILLKGNFALERLNACLHHYDKGTQKGSPLIRIFLIYGRKRTVLFLLVLSLFSGVRSS